MPPRPTEARAWIERALRLYLPDEEIYVEIQECFGEHSTVIARYRTLEGFSASELRLPSALLGNKTQAAQRLVSLALDVKANLPLRNKLEQNRSAQMTLSLGKQTSEAD